MKLAAARARDRLVPRLTLSSGRAYKGLPPLVPTPRPLLPPHATHSTAFTSRKVQILTQVRQAEGLDATDLDYTDDDYTLLESASHGVKRGPTMSERARVLSKLDTHVRSTHTTHTTHTLASSPSSTHTYQYTHTLHIYVCVFIYRWVWCGGSEYPLARTPSTAPTQPQHAATQNVSILLWCFRWGCGE